MTENASPSRGPNKDILLSASGPAAAYLAAELATAPPRRLAELLYDGAIRLCRQAMDAFDADDIGLAAERLARARQIVRQLQTYLPADGAAPAAEDLAAAYRQVHRRLIEAGFYRSRQAIERTLSLLVGRRRAWDAFLSAAGGRGGRIAARASTADWIG